MRVLVDAHMVGGRETGNETYVVNLLTELAQLPGVTCAAAVTPGAILPQKLRQSGLELLPLKTVNNWVRLAYALPTMSRHWRADVLHTTYISPLFAPCAKVVSVHDVAFKRYPEFFSPRDRLLFATLLPWTLRSVDAVITISQHAKAELMDLFPYLRDRIHVTLLAASNTIFCPVDDASLFETIKTRYHIHSKFIVAVGNLQPRKNLMRLIKAFSLVHKQYASLQLVIVGQDQWQSSEIYKLVNDLRLTHEITFTGYVPDEDLKLLYNMATVFVYPSLYEGFGLPVLEAMACGTPVVTSNLSSLPEVAGDVALLIDPYQEQQIAQAILAIVNAPDLATTLSERGKRRAQAFSWHRTAIETTKIYQTISDRLKR